MGADFSKKPGIGIFMFCLCLLLCLSACQNSPATPQMRTESLENVPPVHKLDLQVAAKPQLTATPLPTATATTAPPNVQANAGDGSHPALAFYYPWYNMSSWSSGTMSDLPTIQYNSADDTTIDRQLTWAAGAGITGFISSWWGAGDQTDLNLVKLLAHATTLENKTHYHFASSVYFECDAPNLNTSATMISGLRYLIAHYGNDPHFFHWQGKPVIFFWDPLGNGRTLTQWADIRSQVDPNNQTIWSAEGVNIDLLNVFDGIHLFSAGYWGINNGTMNAVDQGFRTKIDAYNSAHQTHKIWAAGVAPGFDDTRVPGRTGTFILPRNNGATYSTSWKAAIASSPSWITVTSFNEWYEGSMIEPGTKYGSQYLTLTQQYSQQWHG